MKSLSTTIPLTLAIGALVAAMVERPELVQRPIVESEDRAVLARPVERVLELLEP